MVLFTTKFFRKLFYSRFGSVYVNKIVQLLLKFQSQDSIEIQDDDLRGNSVLFIERMGRYDGLSSIYKVPKTGTTVNYWTCNFPDRSFITGWWIFDHVNYNYAAGIGYVRDLSYWDKHARAYGHPCIVSGGSGLALPWRPDSLNSVVTRLDAVDDHYRIPGSAYAMGSISLVFAVYPLSFARTKRYSNYVVQLNEDKNETDDYIQCGNKTNLWSQSLTKFSFSLWVKFIRWPEDDVRVVSHGNTSNQGFMLAYLGSSNKMRFRVKTSGGSINDALANDELEINRWYHFVCTYDNSLGSANIKLYVDGVLQTNTGNMTEAINLVDELTIGSEAGIGNLLSPGCYVKDFRWWTTTPLTAQNAADLYNGLEGSLGGDYHIPMDEGEFNDLADMIAGGTGATLTNGPIWIYDSSWIYNSTDKQFYASKRDDASNKYTVWVETDGVVYFNILDAGTEFKVKSSVALSLNTWSWIVVTFNTSTDTLKIYINGVDRTTTTTAGVLFNGNAGTAFNDLFVCSNNRNSQLANCAIYLFGVEDAAMNSTEITNLFNNKCTMGNDASTEPPAWINYSMVQDT